jgi:hypothetical protein
MRQFEVKFANAVSGWVHTVYTIAAPTLAEAKTLAVAQFKADYAYAEQGFKASIRELAPGAEHAVAQVTSGGAPAPAAQSATAPPPPMPVVDVGGVAFPDDTPAPAPVPTPAQNAQVQAPQTTYANPGAVPGAVAAGGASTIPVGSVVIGPPAPEQAPQAPEPAVSAQDQATFDYFGPGGVR